MVKQALLELMVLLDQLEQLVKLALELLEQLVKLELKALMAILAPLVLLV